MTALSKQSINTIIFDIGNVLVTGDARDTVLGRFGLRRNNIEHFAWKEYEKGAITEMQYWQRVLRNTCIEGKEEMIAAATRAEQDKALPSGAYALLLPLHTAGYRLAIISNHVKAWVDPIIKNFKLGAYCAPIIISDAARLAKPDPGIYELCLAQLNARPE